MKGLEEFAFRALAFAISLSVTLLSRSVRTIMCAHQYQISICEHIHDLVTCSVTIAKTCNGLIQNKSEGPCSIVAVLRKVVGECDVQWR